MRRTLAILGWRPELVVRRRSIIPLKHALASDRGSLRKAPHRGTTSWKSQRPDGPAARNVNTRAEGREVSVSSATNQRLRCELRTDYPSRSHRLSWTPIASKDSAVSSACQYITPNKGVPHKLRPTSDQRPQRLLLLRKHIVKGYGCHRPWKCSRSPGVSKPSAKGSQLKLLTPGDSQREPPKAVVATAQTPCTIAGQSCHARVNFAESRPRELVVFVRATHRQCLRTAASPLPTMRWKIFLYSIASGGRGKTAPSLHTPAPVRPQVT